MTEKTPVLKLALQVAKTYTNNHEAVIPISTNLLGEILTYIESLEAQLEWHISDQADEVKDILDKIADITSSADEDYFKSRDADWWIRGLRNIISEHM